MNEIPMDYGLILAAVLFTIGLAGALFRKNLIFILISVEIMLNAAGLAFIVGGAHWGQADGQVMFIFILTMAAAEVAIGLALIIRMYHQFKTLNSDLANMMKG